MSKSPSVTLADGEPQRPALPRDRRSVKQVARNITITGLTAVGSIPPVRRAAKAATFRTLDAVWRRHKRIQVKRQDR